MAAFEYLTNTDLNAGVPFTNAGNAQLVRPATHKNDWGVTVGGPVRIPKLYNERDKTFFFFNYEGYIDNKNSTPVLTYPTAAMRAGNFGGILTAGILAATFRAPIMENTIYDPATRKTVNGSIVTTAFRNIIPTSRIDPSAAKVQALIPMAQTSGNLNNYTQVYPNNKTQYIPSFKIDQNPWA